MYEDMIVALVIHLNLITIIIIIISHVTVPVFCSTDL